jgi:hypothetical protein
MGTHAGYTPDPGRSWRLSILIPEEVAAHGDDPADWSEHTRGIYEHVRKECGCTPERDARAAGRARRGGVGGLGCPQTPSTLWEAARGLGWETFCRFLDSMGS